MWSWFGPKSGVVVSRTFPPAWRTFIPAACGQTGPADGHRAGRGVIGRDGDEIVFIAGCGRTARAHECASGRSVAEGVGVPGRAGGG